MTTLHPKWILAITDLREAIADVYRVFAKYPTPSSLEASPVEDIDEIKKNLSSVPLERLLPDAIGLFAMCAMTTVGDVAEYKHFLPRIIDLACQGTHGQPGLDPELIASKLAYGDWRHWPAEEKVAIERVYDRASARARLLHPDWQEAEGWLCGNAMIGNRLDDGLDAWITYPTADSMVQLAHFLIGAESIASASAFWHDVSPEIRHQIVDWLLSEAVEASLINAVSDVAEDDRWRFDRLDANISLLKQARWRD